MNVLWALAAVVGLGVALVESQRSDNWEAKARYWHKATEHAQRIVAREQARVRRLEIAAGRRPADEWRPARHTPPAPGVEAPTEAEVHLWLAATDNTPAPYPRFPHAEYQPGNDQVLHRKPRVAWSRRITTGEVEEIVGVQP